MADIEQYKKAIIDAHNKGDYEAAQVLADRLKTLQAAQPDPNLGQQVIGGLETAGTVVSGAIAEPLAGLAGIAQAVNPFAEQGAGAQAVADVRQALTYQPRTETGQRYLQGTAEALQPVGEAFEAAEEYLGENVYEATGSPALAAAAETIPTLATEALGVGVGRRAARSARAAEETAQQSLKQAQDLSKGISTEETVSQGIKTIQEGTPEQIAEMAQLSPEFFSAMDELGISAEPLAAFASESSQFRDISGALRSVPGSVLDVQARNFIEETSRAADNLIEQYGGTLDKAEFDNRFKNQSLQVVDDLADQADNLYSSIREQLPPQTRVNPENAISFLEMKAAEFGGIDELPKELKSVYASITKEGGPTLGLLDQIRKDFGQATRKGMGRFKDTETGLAKAMYNRLASDVDTIAEQNGLQEVTRAASEVVKQRKMLEDNLATLYGNDLRGALGDTLGASIKGLAKGRVDRFIDTMKAIPQEKRGEAVLSYMNDVFKGSGASQQALNPTQFVKWYETVSRSPRAKGALYANLPKESRKAIDNLYTVSKGISNSLGQTVRTGAINSMFNPETGFLRKMVGNAATRAAGIALGGPAGSFALDATQEFLSQSTSGAKRAADLMGSPQFQKLIRDAVRDGVVDGGRLTQKVIDAENKLAKTQKYKSWVDSLSSDDRAALAGGLIPYLFQPQPDQSEENNNSEEQR